MQFLRLKPVIPSHAIGAGDAPLNVHRREQYKPQFTSFAVHNASKSLKDTRTALVPSNNGKFFLCLHPTNTLQILYQ